MLNAHASSAPRDRPRTPLDAAMKRSPYHGSTARRGAGRPWEDAARRASLVRYNAVARRTLQPASVAARPATRAGGAVWAVARAVLAVVAEGAAVEAEVVRGVLDPVPVKVLAWEGVPLVRHAAALQCVMDRQRPRIELVGRPNVQPDAQAVEAVAGAGQAERIALGELVALAEQR